MIGNVYGRCALEGSQGKAPAKGTPGVDSTYGCEIIKMAIYLNIKRPLGGVVTHFTTIPGANIEQCRMFPVKSQKGVTHDQAMTSRGFSKPSRVG